MRNRISYLVALPVAAGLLAWPSSGTAVDLTGTYSGSMKCTSIAPGGKNRSQPVESTVQITQYPNTLTFVHGLGVRIDGVLHHGKMTYSREPKASSVLARCGGTPNLISNTAMHQWEASVKGDKATIKGSSVRYDASFGFIAVCKHSYRRIDTANPAVPAQCP